MSERTHTLIINVHGFYRTWKAGKTRCEFEYWNALGRLLNYPEGFGIFSCEARFNGAVGFYRDGKTVKFILRK